MATTANDYLAEVIEYAGLLVTRGDVLRDLYSIGIKRGSPAMLAYMRAPVHDGPPSHKWEDGDLVNIETGQVVP